MGLKKLIFLHFLRFCGFLQRLCGSIVRNLFDPHRNVSLRPACNQPRRRVERKKEESYGILLTVKPLFNAATLFKKFFLLPVFSKIQKNMLLVTSKCTKKSRHEHFFEILKTRRLTLLHTAKLLFYRTLKIQK